MKKLFFTIISSSLIATSVFPNDQLRTKLDLSTVFKDAMLRDGRSIDFKKEVERLHLYENKIDFLELYNGEIVDRTDIQTLRLLDAHSLILKATGVDGGG